MEEATTAVAACDKLYASLAKSLLDDIVTPSEPSAELAFNILDTLRRESNRRTIIPESAKLVSALTETVGACERHKKKLQARRKMPKSPSSLESGDDDDDKDEDDWDGALTIARVLLGHFKTSSDDPAGNAHGEAALSSLPPPQNDEEDHNHDAPRLSQAEHEGPENEKEPTSSNTKLEKVTFGRKRYSNKNVYEGDLNERGKPHGTGKMVYHNNDIYEGGWFEGKRKGTGTEKLANGGFAEGQWENGKLHGTGTYTEHKGGQILTGQWKAGKMDGKGEQRLANGERYIGMWKKGLMAGRGRRLRRELEEGQETRPGQDGLRQRRVVRGKLEAGQKAWPRGVPAKQRRHVPGGLEA